MDDPLPLVFREASSSVSLTVAAEGGAVNVVVVAEDIGVIVGRPNCGEN